MKFVGSKKYHQEIEKIEVIKAILEKETKKEALLKLFLAMLQTDKIFVTPDFFNELKANFAEEDYYMQTGCYRYRIMHIISDEETKTNRIRLVLEFEENVEEKLLFLNSVTSETFKFLGKRESQKEIIILKISKA